MMNKDMRKLIKDVCEKAKEIFKYDEKYRVMIGDRYDIRIRSNGQTQELMSIEFFDVGRVVVIGRYEILVRDGYDREFEHKLSYTGYDELLEM
jgi:hypothetical protein